MFHALLARAIFMFSENVFLFWDCLDFGVFLRIGSRRNPSWRNSSICQCQELGEVSFNSLLLGRHQSEDNATTGLEHPHGSPGYRVSPLKNGPRQRLLCAHSVAWQRERCSLTSMWRTLRLHRPLAGKVLHQTFKRLKSKLFSCNSSLSLEYLNSEGIKHIHFKEKFKANL